jgi:hypothetical protein
MDRLQVGMWINFTTTAGLPARGQIIRLIYPIYIVVFVNQSLSNLAVQQSTMIHSQTSKAEKTSSNLSFQQKMVVSSQPIQSEKSFSNLHKYHKIMLSTQSS